MDSQAPDQDVRDLYLRNAPSVGDAETWNAIEGRVAVEAVRARPRWRKVRMAAISAGIAALLGAASVGVYEASNHLGGPNEVLVIGDGGTVSTAADGSVAVTTPTGEEVLLTGVRAELYLEIQRVREGLATGTLVFEWDPPAYSDLYVPSDPNVMLDEMEQALLERGSPSSQVILYLTDASGEALALREEIMAMPEVKSCTFTSKDEALARTKEWYKDTPEIFEELVGNPLPASLEVLLEDGADPASFAAQFEGRTEVDEAYCASKETLDAEWTFDLEIIKMTIRPLGSP
jgi:hypothetical protein